MPTTKRRTTKRTTKRATKRTTKRATKRTSKKGAFGGYKINFKGYHDSLEKVFGIRPLAPSEMTKKLWGYVKRKKLAHN